MVLACAVAIGLTGLAGSGAASAELRGPYLGQSPPGPTPLIFAPGFVSTAAHEFSCSFTPDGQEFYFARRDPQANVPLVMVTKCIDGAWTEPTVAPFAQGQMSFEPRVTPDGRRLYFTFTSRGQNGGPPSMNVWFVERVADGWGPPQDPGPPFNPMKSMYISMTRAGAVYTTDISGGPGSEGIAVARPLAGKYATLTRLGPPINVGAQDMYPYIAPDESYLIFASRRAGSPAGKGLFIAWRQPDGTWGEPRAIDLGMPAGTPVVSPDGKYLFFTAGEPGRSDIYWVSTSVLGQ